MDGIKSSLHDVTESFNKLSAKVTETETAQKSDNTTLLTMMAEMKGEIDSLKTEITELKKILCKTNRTKLHCWNDCDKQFNECNYLI